MTELTRLHLGDLVMLEAAIFLALAIVSEVIRFVSEFLDWPT